MTAMEEKEKLCFALLLNCRSSLYSLFPFLDGAFAALSYEACRNTGSLGTDGQKLLFAPGYLIALYGKHPEVVKRGYLHILLHCLYLHPFRQKGRREDLWNLACDMAVEQVIAHENQPSLAIPGDGIRQKCLEILGNRALPAEQIYGLLEEKKFPFSRGEMAASFLFDDHGLWKQADERNQALWEQVLCYTAGHGRRGRQAGRTAGDRVEKLEPIAQGHRDYRDYLRRFAVCREEMELDMDGFDYIYYSLGLERLGNIPLIEPPETREGWKLSQLVIAIDTSGSCSRAVVQDFLRETYSMLSQRENFFRNMEVYLIQCDCLIQSAVVIHSREEWMNYSRDITIAGRGGTDFTPVFQYVDDLRSRGRLRELKALLYFTDGDGYYPRKKPDYEAAFVFLKENQFMEMVPGWAKTLVVGQG